MDTLSEIEGEEFGILIGDLIGSDDHTQFTSCLQGIGLHYAREGHSKVLQVVETFHIRLHDLTTGTRTGTGDRIAGLYDRSDDGGHLALIVVSTHRIADIGFLSVFLTEFHTKLCVRQFDIIIGYFTNIVEKTGTFSCLDVQT